MKLKEVYNNIIPFKGYIALTLYPWVFIRNKYKKKYTSKVKRHEETHGFQQIETMWVFFLIIYILEYIIKSVCLLSFKKGYHSISFEQEAYINQDNKDYNTQRKHYAWVKYIFSLYYK